MGCDIHFYVENKFEGKWFNVFSDEWYVDRNYLLFGLLAGVRSNLLNPISPIKGLPSDVSPFVLKERESWSVDAHSMSYYLLSELLAVKNNNFMLPVSLNITGYKKYKKGNILPDEYYYYPPLNAKVISNEKMDKIINMVAFLDDNNYYSNLKVPQTYSDISSQFWDEIVPAMEKYSSHPDDVRCVFWFDN